MTLNKWSTLGLSVVAALVVSAALVVGADRMGLSPQHGPQGRIGEPWQIEVLPGGQSRILGPGGLVLGLADGTAGTAASTLADVQALWPDTSQAAIVAAPDELGNLEVYVDPAQLGRVTGKLVLALGVAPDRLQAMRARTPQARYMESTTRKFTLAPEDMAEARRAPIVAASFIPQANLDEATVIERFGPPSERIATTEGVVHLLYPERGLDIALHPKQKDVLQFVAPADFKRLREPLVQAASRPASAP